MTLQNNLYTIERFEQDGTAVCFYVKLNRECAIYNMHFPDHPVTPGACTIQMAVELICTYLDKMLNLKQIKNVKFLSVINPDETTDLQFRISISESDNSEIKAKVEVAANEVVYAKLSLLLC